MIKMELNMLLRFSVKKVVAFRLPGIQSWIIWAGKSAIGCPRTVVYKSTWIVLNLMARVYPIICDDKDEK